MLSNDFAADFCSKLNRDGLLIEIAEAEAGTSNLNTAKHYKSLSPDDLNRIINQKSGKNLSFASGIKPSEGLRRCKSKDIASRNIITFDIDLKDQDEGFAALDRDNKLNRVRAIFDANKHKIEGVLGDIWSAVYSGNGLHIHFYSSNPIDCADEKKYEAFYSQCLTALESKVPLRFDQAFKKPGQLIRLPGSLNLKNKLAPLATEVIYHNPKADSSSQLHTAFNDAAAQIAAQKVIHIHRPELLNSDDHKANLKAALTFENVLNHFSYDKWHLAQKNRTVISAPWRADKTPSVHLDHAGKFFNDFGDSSKKGDVFNMIAECAGLNIKTQFPDVIKIAEEITGIEKPKKAKVAREKSSNNSTDNSPDRLSLASEFSRFFEQNLPQLSVCRLTDMIGYKDGNDWKSIETEIKWLRALAKEQGLSKNDVEDYLALHAKSLDKRLLADIPQWDGTDRIKDICQRTKLKNLSSDHLETLMKGWGAKMMGRVNDSYIQNTMPIFRGLQGRGKDVFIRYMTTGLGRYYNSCKIGLHGKEIEDYRNMYQSVAIHIEELKTRDICPSHFKDLITKSSATWRRMRVDGTTKHWFHCSFIASSNDDEVLTDFTGNRRFWIFDFEGLPYQDYWDYPASETTQIIAQYMRLSEENYKPEQEALDDMEQIVKAETPKSPTELILETFDNEMTDWEMVSQGQKVRRGGGRELCNDIARYVGHGVTAMRVSKVLADNGRSRKGAKNQPEYFRPENNPAG